MEVEKVVKVVAITLVSFLIADILVNALSQVVMFLAWLAIGFILFKAFEETSEELMQNPTNTMIAVVVSGILSAILVVFMSDVVLAMAKIGLTIILVYLLLRSFAPDVYMQIKEVVEGGK